MKKSIKSRERYLARDLCQWSALKEAAGAMFSWTAEWENHRAMDMFKHGRVSRVLKWGTTSTGPRVGSFLWGASSLTLSMSITSSKRLYSKCSGAGLNNLWRSHPTHSFYDSMFILEVNKSCSPCTSPIQACQTAVATNSKLHKISFENVIWERPASTEHTGELDRMLKRACLRSSIPFKRKQFYSPFCLCGISIALGFISCLQLRTWIFWEGSR